MHRFLHDDVRILWPPNTTILFIHRDENELRQKRWFFGKNAHLQSSVVQPIGRTENASDGHAASILVLMWILYGFIPKSLFKILLKEVCEMFKFCERWRVDVDGSSSTLWATAAMFSVDLTGRTRERVALSNKDPVCRIHKLIHKLRWRHFFSIKFFT